MTIWGKADRGHANLKLKKENANRTVWCTNARYSLGTNSSVKKSVQFVTNLTSVPTFCHLRLSDLSVCDKIWAHFFWFDGICQINLIEELVPQPRNMKIFPHSKFGINQTAGSKVMAKKNFEIRLFKFLPFSAYSFHVHSQRGCIL